MLAIEKILSVARSFQTTKEWFDLCNMAEKEISGIVEDGVLFSDETIDALPSDLFEKEIDPNDPIEILNRRLIEEGISELETWKSVLNQELAETIGASLQRYLLLKEKRGADIETLQYFIKQNVEEYDAKQKIETRDGIGNV